MVKDLEDAQDGIAQEGAKRRADKFKEALTKLKYIEFSNPEKLLFIQRYESAHQNGLYKALHELQRL